MELPNGIPSHDTFGRVFSLLAPEAFEACFRAWVASIRTVIPGEIIAIDGKTLRRSHNRAKGLAALHLVSAWATANRVVLGQVATDAKSNEITAIVELLALLMLKGAIVTIDAMGCQTKIAEQIIDQGGNYVLALKGNQGTLAAAGRCADATPATCSPGVSLSVSCWGLARGCLLRPPALSFPVSPSPHLAEPPAQPARCAAPMSPRRLRVTIIHRSCIIALLA